MKCNKCTKDFPNKITINNKRHNLQNRKFCFECSPFGKHNTRSLIDLDLTCLVCGDPFKGNQTKYCSDKCRPIGNNKNNYAAQKLRAISRKREFITQLGGKCQNCGYAKNMSALTFHHKNPKDKMFELDCRKISNSTLESLQKELLKCELLCANCHAELHNPESTLI